MKPKTITVTDIQYDTDGKKIKLPKKLTITIPEGMTDQNEIEEHLSDEISNITGFCHFRFKIK